MGTILIGYLSDKLLQQVKLHRSFIHLKFLQDRGKNYEHARAPVLFPISILLMIVLRLLNSAVQPRVSEVSQFNMEYKQNFIILYFLNTGGFEWTAVLCGWSDRGKH